MQPTREKAEAKELVDSFFEIMASELEQGREVKLAGFGNFELRDKAARPGRNPRTSEDALISARRVVTFRASRKWKEMFQKKPDIFG